MQKSKYRLDELSTVFYLTLFYFEREHKRFPLNSSSLIHFKGWDLPRKTISPALCLRVGENICVF